MTMRDYKGWSAAERMASLKKTKAAIAAGVIPLPSKCNRCGKETGRIDYHNHDYSDPIKYLEELCQGCHTRLHRMENKEQESKENEIPPKKIDMVESGAPAPKKKTTKTSSPSDLNHWLEKGMEMSAAELADHVVNIPKGIKPLMALRGLGIVFSNGFTKNYDCNGYPQTSGLGKDRTKFNIVLARVKHYEKNGESLKVKGFSLSEKLKSNFDNNPE